jgi:hypothetical protein
MLRLEVTDIKKSWRAIWAAKSTNRYRETENEP